MLTIMLNQNNNDRESSCLLRPRFRSRLYECDFLATAHNLCVEFMHATIGVFYSLLIITLIKHFLRTYPSRFIATIPIFQLHPPRARFAIGIDV